MKILGIFFDSVYRMNSRHPLISIIVILAITFMMMTSAMSLRPSFENLDFIPQGSESREIIESHTNNFPATTVTIIVTSSNVADTEVFEMMHTLTLEYNKFDEVKAVKSPSEQLMAQYQEIPDGDIIEDTFLGTGVMPDRSSVIMEVILHEYDSDKGDAIAEELLRIADYTPKPEGVELKFLDDPVLNYELNQSANENNVIMFLSSVFLMVLLLYLISSNNVRGILMPFAPLLVAVISVFWVMGTLSIFNIRLTPITVAFLPILIGLSLDYGIIIQNRYEEEIRSGRSIPQSLRQTIHNSGSGIIIALITTILGFSSLLLTGVPSLQSFGFSLVVGLATSFIVSITFLTALISMRDKCCKYLENDEMLDDVDQIKTSPSNTVTDNNDRIFDRVMGWIVHRSIKHGAVILMVSLVIFSYGALNYGNLPFVSDPLDYYPDDMDFNRNLAYLESHFGQGETVNVVITGMDIREPRNLEHILEIERYVASMEDKITSSISIASMSEESFGAIPSSREEIDDFIDTIPDSGDHVLGNSKIVITFYTSKLNDEEFGPILESISRDVEFFSPFTDFYIYGTPMVKESITNGMVSGQNIMTIISFMLVFLALLLIFRDTSKAVLSIIPVMVVVSATIISMQVLKVPHTMLSVSINTVIIGTGIDYSVHLVERFEEEMRNGLAPLEAIESSWKNMGRSVFTASASTAGGFLAMKASPFPIFQYFGTIAVISILCALFFTFIMLPPLLILRGKLGTLVTRPILIKRMRGMKL